MVAQLQQYYRETVVPKLQKEFGYTSVMQVPKVTKVVLKHWFR